MRYTRAASWLLFCWACASSSSAQNLGLGPDGIRFGDDTVQSTAASRAMPVVFPLLFQGAVAFDNGVRLPAAGVSEAATYFMVPPGHEETDPLFFDIVFLENSSAACSIRFQANAYVSSFSDGPGFEHWIIDGLSDASGFVTLDVPSGSNSVFGLTLELEPDSGFDAAGDALSFNFRRLGDDAADSCALIVIVGAQVRY